jgi:hypothetical protein
MRGLVMALMALDHTRDFFSKPENLDLTWLEWKSAPLYFTRWISHLCAPTFVFLAGAGAYLMSTRRSRGELVWFLVTRGAMPVGESTRALALSGSSLWGMGRVLAPGRDDGAEMGGGLGGQQVLPRDVAPSRDTDGGEFAGGNPAANDDAGETRQLSGGGDGDQITLWIRFAAVVAW